MRSLAAGGCLDWDGFGDADRALAVSSNFDKTSFVGSGDLLDALACDS